MAAPTNTYDSNTDLSLGQIPQVDDPDLYIALLDIHNAIEALLTSSDDGDAAFAGKFRNITEVAANYTVVAGDGTIRVDATAGDVVITMLSVVGITGFRYDVKRVDLVPANSVVIVGDGTELIDGRAAGIKVSTKSSYTVKAHDTGWDII